MDRFFNHELYMRLALEQARQAAEVGEIPVGAILIDQNGEILAATHNSTEADHSPLAHAEMRAIEEGCRKKKGWRLSDCTMYVTLEPCPMCMGAMIHARIGKVVYGAKDARAGACGSVVDLTAYPLESKPICESGVLETESQDLLRAFFRSKRDSIEI